MHQIRFNGLSLQGLLKAHLISKYTVYRVLYTTKVFGSSKFEVCKRARQQPNTFFLKMLSPWYLSILNCTSVKNSQVNITLSSLLHLCDVKSWVNLQNSQVNSEQWKFIYIACLKQSAERAQNMKKKKKKKNIKTFKLQVISLGCAGMHHQWCSWTYIHI